LLREKKPVEFFNAVRRIGGIIEEGFPGIYYIKGISMIDTQLVIFEELDEKTHSSLRVLSKTLNVNDARIFLKNTEDINNPGDRDNMNAVLEVSILANRDIYQWLKREEFGMCEALKDLMKDEIDEAVTEAVTQAVTENDKKNAAETEKKVISLIEALMSSSHIDADKAMELLQIPTGERMGLKQKIEASELQRA
jgi:16S rRNA G527 N7-methylase RsmG